MNLLMPSLTKAPNGDYFSRKAIPPDVREAYARAFGVKREALFRFPVAASVSDAKKAHAEWLAEVEGRIARLRAAGDGRPVSLSLRELHDLAARWYVWFIANHERDLGSVEQWDHATDQMRDVWESAGGIGHPGEPEDAPIGAAHRRRIRAKLEELSLLPSFLAADGVVLSDLARHELLDDVLPTDFGAALRRLHRLAEGRPGSDPHLTLLGTSTKRTPLIGAKLAGWSTWEAFAAWVNEAKPRPSTVNRWRGVFKHLDGFLEGRDIAAVTADDIIKWKDQLVAGNAGPRTIKDIWLTAARTIFNYAVAQRKIETNPASGVKVAGLRKVATKGEFKDEDAQAILAATLVARSTATSHFLRSAIRWVPWLCAYTGSRPGEMTQLRREDVERHRDGFWLVHIRSDAGTVKGQIDRTVVLHEHLVAQGFLDFVEGSAGGRCSTAQAERSPKQLTRSTLLGRLSSSLGRSSPTGCETRWA